MTQTNNAEFEIAADDSVTGGQGQDQPNIFRATGVNNIFGAQKNF